nr:hypothetical protein 19 [bacterium]
MYSFGEITQNDEKSQVLIVKQTPCHYSDMCEITLRIDWQMLETLRRAFAPFLNALFKGCDLRTEEEIKRDHAAKESEIRHKALRREKEVRFRYAKKLIHNKGISYIEFCNITLNVNPREKSPAEWHGSRNLQKIYAEERKKCMIRMKNDGKSYAEIGKFFDLTKSSVSSAINKKPSKNKEASKQDSNRKKFITKLVYKELQAQGLPPSEFNKKYDEYLKSDRDEYMLSPEIRARIQAYDNSFCRKGRYITDETGEVTFKLEDLR